MKKAHDLKKITNDDFHLKYKKISNMSPAEKDMNLASLAILTDKIIDILQVIVPNIHLSLKDKAEIEKAFSIGPSWLNFSFKQKKSK